ncbi:MAG: hypothetical protein KJO49_13085 [Bacteroidia bacterium]|nr:hypothetical protein [Bacteroidia bacterium]MBT8269312.1 hypothetical protein [Bacteroidia bacterium]NNK69358.1 hypothetical protein [Flavobacteriaceae bacterium]NNL79282.1 hypothetical protein [Flavobacteriaceae bacterium]
MDRLTEFIQENRAAFDHEEPQTGHEKRFMAKLNAQQDNRSGGSTSSTSWKPLFMIAASIALMLVLVIGSGITTDRDLSSVSPEMANTQEFFTTAISAELEKLNSEESPEYQNLIVDALFQINLLEQEYIQLKTDLDESGNDKRVIHAMISNFQNRIDILKQVSEQIEELKQTKDQNNENIYTL